MSSYPARPGRRRTSPLVLLARQAADLPDALLIQDHDQALANSTGQPVGDCRPQFYGMPKAAAGDARRAEVLGAEVKRRGLVRSA